MNHTSMLSCNKNCITMIFLHLHSNIFLFLLQRDTQHSADESMFSASNEIHFPKRYDGNVFETTFLFSNQFWFVSKETNVFCTHITFPC